MNTFFNVKFWNKVKIVFLAILSVIAICLVIFFPVHAEELPDTTIDENNGVDTSFDGSVEDLEPILSAYNLSSIDLNSLDDDEKLTAIENRLNELGYAINEETEIIESIIERLDDSDQEHLEIREELEVVIIGLNQLCENSLEFLESYSENSDLYNAAIESTENSHTEISDSLVEINENTVSGNNLITALGDDLKVDMENISQTSIEEFNNTLIKTNTLLSYMFWLMLFVLVFIICFFIGQILKKIFGNIK